ncbi:hypothetical protein EJ08DRAFT_652701 [Tothia fuscella]|uniref:Uncharacterized protein n=1 Tax=Tothia fuscella TaxID=1048955 RepID=A0A9P4NJL5_9PEZI|nr:hypothetical protein EJ08DRAFT_652701 [Tothia fuscella]
MFLGLRGHASLLFFFRPLLVQLFVLIRSASFGRCTHVRRKRRNDLVGFINSSLIKNCLKYGNRSPPSTNPFSSHAVPEKSAM